MQLHADDATVEAFRQEYRTWLAANRPTAADLADAPLSTGHIPEWARAWQQQQFDAGWLMPAWEPARGGRNATPSEEMAYFEELARSEVQRTANSQGLVVVAPALLAYGDERQKAEFAIPTLRAERSWCLGISEPGAGSDLGSLSTSADVLEDHFVVNGQKIWTSGALHADYCWCLVRTDREARRHAGISVLMIDMRSDGISCRPIGELDDPRHADFNEVFFTDVVVPRENLVGTLNEGWAIAMGSVSRDRVLMWLSDLTTIERNAARLRELAPRPAPGGGRWGEDARYRARIGAHYVDALAMRCMSHRGISEYSRGLVSPVQSVLKIFGAETAQRMYLDALDFLGPVAFERDEAATPTMGGWGASWAVDYLLSFVGTVGGGTVEIQRNIIAQHVLGLPRR